jgi:malate dehydrogenase
MNVSIVGAAGEVGRALAVHLLRGGVLRASDRLQLLGHGHEAGERKLLAERCDLLDAFDEIAPAVDIAGEPEEVSGDVIVIAGGVTLGGSIVDRRQLAEANRVVFESFGKALAECGTGRELVVVVTNPVELGVEIVSRWISRHRVLGMGAQQDSLRFARAIAADVGVRRDNIHAWVCGEHGAAQVPLWSSVRIRGVEPSAAELSRFRREPRDQRFGDELREHQTTIRELLLADRVKEAFTAVEALAPDLRAAIEPFVTFHCLHSTPSATANATCDVIRAVQSGREAVVGAQVRLDGEFRGFQTTIGVPVLVDSSGWKAVVCPELSVAEGTELDIVAATLRQNLAEWTSGLPRSR